MAFTQFVLMVYIHRWRNCTFILWWSNHLLLFKRPLLHLLREWERERERETEIHNLYRETDRQTDRQTYIHTEREREKRIQRYTQRDSEYNPENKIVPDASTTTTINGHTIHLHHPICICCCYGDVSMAIQFSCLALWLADPNVLIQWLSREKCERGAVQEDIALPLMVWS